MFAGDCTQLLLLFTHISVPLVVVTIRCCRLIINMHISSNCAIIFDCMNLCEIYGQYFAGSAVHQTVQPIHRRMSCTVKVFIYLHWTLEQLMQSNHVFNKHSHDLYNTSIQDYHKYKKHENLSHIDLDRDLSTIPPCHRKQRYPENQVIRKRIK